MAERRNIRGIKRPKLADVRSYPWVGGEWVVTYDPDNPRINYRYQVLTVEGKYPGVVTLTGKVTSQGHPDHRPGDEIKVLLAPQGSPYMAMVVPNGVEDDSEVLDGFTDANVINFQVMAFLKTRAIKKHSAQIWMILLYLQSSEVGVLPEDKDYYDPTRGTGKECQGKDYDEGSKLVRACAKATRGLLKVNGGNIRLDTEFNEGMTRSGQISDTRNGPGFVTLDREKYIQAHILMAESGALGFNVRWK